MQSVLKSSNNITTNPNNTSPTPPTVITGTNFTFDNATGNLSLCFPKVGIIIYENVDISKSEAYF